MEWKYVGYALAISVLCSGLMLRMCDRAYDSALEKKVQKPNIECTMNYCVDKDETDSGIRDTLDSKF